MTGVILAGGKSSRMGFNKAFIEIPVPAGSKQGNGLKIIERTVNLFKEIFDEVIIVTNTPLEYEYLDVRIVADIIKEKGALGGIFTGIFHSSSEYSFVSACDMPFLDKDIIAKMTEMPMKWDVIIPFENDSLHPVHAIYSKKCLKPMEDAIKEDKLKIQDILKCLKIKKVEDIFKTKAAISSLSNINTLNDLNEILSPA